VGVLERELAGSEQPFDANEAQRPMIAMKQLRLHVSWLDGRLSELLEAGMRFHGDLGT